MDFSTNWVELLERHFTRRKKAFLIFDQNNVLRYASEHAREILEYDESHIGFVTLDDLFPATKRHPDFLVDQNYSMQSIDHVMYTTPSGRSKELRVNRDKDILEAGDVSGYVLWLEEKMRDITATYRRVSSLDPYLRMGWLLDQNQLGFVLIDSDGIIKKYNPVFEKLLDLPGEWLGRSLYSVPFLHQHSIVRFIQKCLKNHRDPQSKLFELRYPGDGKTRVVRWSAQALSDISGTTIGALISTNSED